MSKFHGIHLRAVRAVKKYGEAEAELLSALQEVDRHKVFLKYECGSLFQYAVQKLGMTESVALNFIGVARKAAEVPALKREIEAGALSVSKAKKITSVLTPENQSEWLEKARTLPQKALEKEVARVAPKEATPEKATYVSESRLDLRMGVSEEIMQKLKRAQDLMSQKCKKAASYEETLEAALDVFLDREDPVRKADRVLAKQALLKKGSLKQTDLVKTQVARPVNRSKQSRIPILAQNEQIVNQRDQGQCAHIDENGKRCENRRWLDIHHICPVELGGDNSPENLITLCSAHHRALHAGQIELLHRGASDALLDVRSVAS